MDLPRLTRNGRLLLNNHRLQSLKILLYQIYHNDIGRLIARWGKEGFHMLWGIKPIPFFLLYFFSKVIPKSEFVNGLFIKDEKHSNSSTCINNPTISQILRNQQIGDWSLDAETINFLEKDIKQKKPVRILEFGSGISTLCLAQFIKEIYGAERLIRLYSIEQDKEYANQSECLLKEYSFIGYTKILYTPLSKKIVEGIECYTYNPSAIAEFLYGLEFDYCLIDGPSVSTYDGRFATLPLFKNFLSNRTRFILDDALRGNELIIARNWKRLPNIDIQGIILTRKGLLIGSLKNER
jgi:hypothetical protein